MKTSRRKFLQWSGIGALGAVVFSGCGIPEKELLVQSPALIPEDLVSGLEAWYATSCGQCAVGEGIIVRVIEGRAIKIEGNPDHPISRGKSSAQCQAGLQALYNPQRLAAPMKLRGARGSGDYEEISWEAALSEVAELLKGQAPASVVLLTEPLRGSLGMVARTFMEAYGGQHLGYEALEQTTLRVALKQVFGADQLPDFDIDHADFVLSFGSDFLSSWLSPVRFNRGYGEFRQGGNTRGALVQVESRFSMTAANADRWVYVRPGREGEVALSVAYVLLAEHSERLDPAAANILTRGRGAAALEAFRPEAVAASTGVSEEQIKELAKALAEHQRPLVIGGGSAGAGTNGLSNLEAIYALDSLLGVLGKSGGVLFSPGAPVDGLPAAPKVGSFADWQALADRMRGGGVKVALVHGANPVYGLPADLGFGDALGRAEVVVSFSSFMDETTALADYILPDHVYLEAWGDDIPEPGPGYQVVTFQQPVVKPLVNTAAFADSLLGLARRIGGKVDQAFPKTWATMKDVLRDTARKLQAQGRGSVQAASFDAFWNTVLQRGGWWDVNRKGATPGLSPIRLPASPVEPQFAGPGAGGFYLVPFASHSLGDGKGANLPWLQATPDPVTTATWQTWVEINSRPAEAMGIKVGDELEISSPRGVLRALAYPHPGVSPEVVCIPTGQGHTHYGDYEVGPDLYRIRVARDRGANVLSVVAPSQVDGTGALAWASTRVSVRKTGAFYRLPRLEGPVFADFRAVEEHVPLSTA
ncbi:MAG: molybdopterin-dependent oxidoreductase [Chloroflexi bacterium]|nr:molybdopterin-dependent oxidoreductase [Chloroflexota bacterium]